MTVLSICIPTRGRAERQLTWARLPWEWKARTWLVVDADEAVAHARFDHLLVYPGGPGIALKRQWILAHAPSPYCLMLDDDLDFVQRDAVGKLHAATATEITAGLERLEGWLTESFIHVGIGPRAGNHTVTTPWADVTRQYSAMGYNVEAVLASGARFAPETDPMEDFDMTLQLLERGFPNRVSYDFAVGSAGANAAGGCSLYRTADRMTQAAAALAARHPGIVTIVQKQGSWKGLAQRTDVEIAWKRAYRQRHQATLL